MGMQPLFPSDTPATYRILVTGPLESELAEQRWGMTCQLAGESGVPVQTALVGEVADQAALVGVINALYNMGHKVLLVECFGNRYDESRLMVNSGHLEKRSKS